MLFSITHSKSKRFLSYCLAFLIGVAIVSIVDSRIDPYVLYISFFIPILFFILWWKHPTLRFFSFLLLAFMLGIIRYQLAFPLTSSHISNMNDEKVELIGYVVAEPDVRMDGVRYIVYSQQTTDSSKSVHGRVYVKTGLYPRYRYGDVLDLECRLKAPEQIEDFRYDRYLARYGVFSICEGAKISKQGGEGGKGNELFRGILATKEVVAEKINTLWHEPYASFMAGLLYGYRGGLGQLNELFSRTGVTHIVAISGYNITIIATLLLIFCKQLRIPRKKAFWFVVSGIIVFLIFAGLSASVVRAGIMGILVLLATQIGRTSRIGNVLVLTAVVMTLHNPFILIWDAGFQLSFLSTIGLIYLAPLIEPWMTRVPTMGGVRESLVATLAATIVTLPLILFQFGRLSVVAVPVNMLILWSIPFIMMIGFCAVIIGFLFLPVGSVVAWIAWGGMAYIVSVVSWFAGLPFAAVDIQIPVWVMVGAYMGLLYYLVSVWKKQKTPVGI